MEVMKTEELTITAEAIKMVESMNIMSMVVEIIYLIAETLSEVIEGEEHFLIKLPLWYHQQRCMICIMLQILQNLILYHTHNHILMWILLVLEIK